MPRQACHAVSKPVCNTVYSQKCTQVPDQICHHVPKTECQKVPKQGKCHQVPAKSCKQVAVQVNTSFLLHMYLTPNILSMQVPATVPRQVCDQAGYDQGR